MRNLPISFCTYIPVMENRPRYANTGARCDNVTIELCWKCISMNITLKVIVKGCSNSKLNSVIAIRTNHMQDQNKIYRGSYMTSEGWLFIQRFYH